MAGKAADHFLNDTLPLDPESGTMQTPQQYVEQVSATTGMPFSNVRRNMNKVHGVLDKVEDVLAGLTRGLDLSVLDAGYGTVRGQMLSFFPRTDALGVVLPSNSPGVHSLWAPTPVLKMPLVLKPGSAEPWTPLRIINAWVKAGVPAGVFCVLPDRSRRRQRDPALDRPRHGVRRCRLDEAMEGDGRVEVHGPGYSKVVIGPDVADDWEQFIDVIAESMSNNGGRSCVNASGVWVTRHADKIAEALAKKLAAVSPRAADDPDALLAPFADPETARRISATIDADMTRRERSALEMCPRVVRGADRVASAHGGTYLLPTVVRCEANHPLANREFLFPFASVVEVPAADLPDCLGPSLVVTCISNDPAFRARFVASPHVDRLNLGPLSTTQIGWDQPHEGNLFEHLYARRAFRGSRLMDGRAVNVRVLFTAAILLPYAGAASMYCGSCLRDNALAAELIRQGHDVTLLPFYTPTLTDEDERQPPAEGVLRRHQRLPRTAHTVVPTRPAARCDRRRAARDQSVHQRLDRRRSKAAWRDDRIDPARRQRPSAQGDRQADRVRDRRCAAGRDQHSVHAPDRPGRAARSARSDGPSSSRCRAKTCFWRARPSRIEPKHSISSARRSPTSTCSSPSASTTRASCATTCAFRIRRCAWRRLVSTPAISR